MNQAKFRINRVFIALLAVVLACSPLFAAPSPAKQLEKGKQLFEQGKNDEAMDAFIEVLVNGSRTEVEEANQYINRIHNRIGGVDEPVAVDENYQEGAVSHLQTEQDPAVLQKQLEAETAPLVEDVEEVEGAADAQADEAALAAQRQSEELAHQAQQAQTETGAALAAYPTEEAPKNETEEITSTYTELTSPEALKARQLYTEQKLESMQQAAIAKLNKEKGVRLYMRNGQPDAIDIDSSVLFDGYKFRQDAFPILNEVYTLMVLTQGAGYIILPPGSYTDNITLSGIRHAMALNSFFVHKGLSSGKISYNMGLYDQEPPAKFANLDGISIVFDYTAELPASLPDAASINKMPLLSMAVAPVSNKIDTSAGEAFVIDFSVIETESPIESWVFQVVQHGALDTYYVVRQLEGFSSVYHQLLWNARKGVIGRELACGQYTLVLTATDVQGGKRTLRRQVEVTCGGKKAASKAATSAAKSSSAASKLNYKSPRLWNKPGRIMRATSAAEPEPAEAENAAYVDPFAANTTPSYTDDSLNSAQPAADYNNQAQGVSNPYDMPYEN